MMNNEVIYIMTSVMIRNNSNNSNSNLLAARPEPRASPGPARSQSVQRKASLVQFFVV